MKTKLILTIAFFGVFTICLGQQNSTWDKWNRLMGEWKGEGSGQPGQGGGVCSFAFDLNKKIIVRKNHSEYPATDKKPLIIHDDLMIIYLDYSGTPSRAIYFDNETHTINYSISYSDSSIVMLSEKINNFPIFRLTYISVDNQTMIVKFEISQNGEKFMTYTEGKCKKTK